LNGETGEVILGSGQRALAAMPPITRVVLCELQTRTANRLESTLREAYPDRDLVALAGDGNVEIRCYLKTLTVDWRRYAAVFAMVDQYSAEVTWETLKYLSTWRLNRRGFKVELWLYFGHGLLLGLPGLAGRQLSSSAVRSRVSQVRAAWRSPSSSS
jgi:three-Cys-motif partner protein